MIQAFAVRQVAMAQMHDASKKAAPRRAAPETADNALGEVSEELTALRAIVEGTAAHTGEAYFESLVRHLATAVETRYAFVAEFAGGRGRARWRFGFGTGSPTMSSGT